MTNKKNDEQKISVEEFLKRKIGMLSSRDAEQRLHCPACRRRTLSADFSKRKPIFNCVSCRRSAAGVWEFLAKFDAFAPRSLEEARARLDALDVDHSGVPDAAVFQDDIMRAEAAKERRELQSRREARAARAAQ